MGTNFYWITEKYKPIKLITGEKIRPDIDCDDPLIHVGKRSGAGKFCYKCKITLCRGGNEKIHHSGNEWHELCPNCHNIENVKHACSFSWAQEPNRVKEICKLNPYKKIIEDEYCKTFTGREFTKMIEDDCPIEFTHSLGKKFC